MPDVTPSETDPGGARRRWAISAGAAAFLVVVAAAAVLIRAASQATGTQLYDANAPSDHLWSAVELTVAGFEGLAKTATLFLGAVAFLLTYQRERKLVLSRRAMSFAAAAVVLLVGAIVCALLGNEAVLTMVGRDAMDLSLPALAWSRRFLYLFVITGSLAVGLFGLELMAAK